MVEKSTGKGTPERYRISVPVADATVNEWMGVQENVSMSIRLVVREYIERHGIDDPTCRPVEALPRRGRPPGSTTRDREDSDRRETEVMDEVDRSKSSESPAKEPAKPVRTSRSENVEPDVTPDDDDQFDMSTIFGR